MPKLTANHGKEYCLTRADLLSSTARAITVCIGCLPAHHCRLCQKPALQTLPTRAWAAPWAAPQGQDIISATIFPPTRMTAGLKLLSLSTSCPPATNASPPAGYPGSLEACQQANPPAGPPGSQAAKWPADRTASGPASQLSKQAASQHTSHPGSQRASSHVG
jgi:hypothetical protein